MLTRTRISFVLATLCAGGAHADDRSWIDESNTQAQVLLGDYRQVRA